MKKLLALLLAVAMVACMLAACAPAEESKSPDAPAAEAPAADSKPIELTVWHLFGEADTPGHPHLYYTEWAERYNAAHPEVHVTVLGGKSATDIQTAVAAGETPDIFMNYWNNAPQWSEAGALLDLTPYYESDAEFDYKDFMPGALGVSNYNGKFYSVPNSFSSTFMFYREDILAEAGWDHFPADTDELLQCIRDTTEANEDGSIKRLGLLPNMPWFDSLVWAAAYNVEWLSEDGKTVTADSENGVGMLNFVNDIYKLYNEEFGWDTLTVNDFGDTVRGNRATANDPVLTGEVAMRWNSEGLVNQLCEFGVDVAWDVAPIPNVAGGEAMGMLTANVWEINAKTKNPDAAWAALADLTGKENQKIMAAGEYGNGAFYSRRSTIEYVRDTLADELGAAKENAAIGTKLSECLKSFADIMLDGNLRNFPCCGFVNEYLNSIGTNCGLVFSGELTAEEAMANVVAEVQPLVDEKPYIPYN